MRVRKDYTMQIMNCLNSFKEVHKLNGGKSVLSFTKFAQNKCLGPFEVQAIFKMKLIQYEKRGYYTLGYSEITKQQARKINTEANKLQKGYVAGYNKRMEEKELQKVQELSSPTPIVAEGKIANDITPAEKPAKEQPRKKSFSMLWGMIKFEY